MRTPAGEPALSPRQRILLTAVFAVLGAALAGFRDQAADLDIVTGGARAWLAGTSPYEAVGPGRAVEWAFPLLYPFTAVLLVSPLTFLPSPTAWFGGLGMALFVWGITSRRELRWAWFAVPTFAVFHAVRMVQWSPIVTGAALVPTFGFVLSSKPTIGAALWLAYPRLRSLLGCVALLTVTLLVRPQWPFEWREVLQQTGHMVAPVMYPTGPFLLLGLLKWRRPEARLLVGLACVPQTAFLYEALPLFLIPRKYEEGLLLALATYAVIVAVQAFVPQWQSLDPTARYMAERQVMGQWMVWVLYLPCLLMVLRRSNVWSDASAGTRESLGRGENSAPSA